MFILKCDFKDLLRSGCFGCLVTVFTIGYSGSQYELYFITALS